MASSSRLKRAARAIQAECGIKFTTARQWVYERQQEIAEMTVVDGRPNWFEFNAAAVGLWRRTHPEEWLERSSKPAAD
jgi:hypothetical protein